MNQLNIAFVKNLDRDSSFDNINAALNNFRTQSLDNLLWSNDGYKPLVNFTIAHNGSCIFLRYTIREDSVRACYHNTNDPVYNDSCVEFFISIAGDANYYNLEFNCLGTCTAGYGNNRFNRTILPAEVINNIRSQTKLERVNSDFVFEWSITLTIPVNVFMYHRDIKLTGEACRLNFYKCGDALPQPHFIAWNNIETDVPNFHLSQFFGEGLFLNQ